VVCLEKLERWKNRPKLYRKIILFDSIRLASTTVLFQ
jgi:hypothetical protein